MPSIACCPCQGKQRVQRVARDERERERYARIQHTLVIVLFFRQNPSDRMQGMTATGAVVCSASLAASIAIEPIQEENQSNNSLEGSGRLHGPETDITSVQNMSVELRLNGGRLLANEQYVRDLRPREISIVSTGALGQLITQVIEEETSSDVEGERIL